MDRLDLLCLGEALVEFNDQGGGRWFESIGGDVSNVAIAASRQGARAGLATRLGTDRFGDRLVQRWTEEKVAIDAVERDPTAPTGLYFIRRRDREYRHTYRRTGTAASLLSPDTLPSAALRLTRTLHVSAISQVIGEHTAAACAAAMDEARAAGARVSYAPKLRPALRSLEQSRDLILASMRGADVVLTALDDARKLSGLTDARDVLAFHQDQGARMTVMTLDTDGAMISRDGVVTEIAPHPAHSVDRVGFGDCFAGAFLARWMATDDPVAAARYAVVAAALSTEGYGAVATIPTRVQVKAALAAGRADAPAAGTALGGSEAGDKPRLALVAHDARKDAMISWGLRHHDQLGRCEIVATGTTGGRLAAAMPDLSVRRLRSGPLGGDQQIGAMIAEKALDGLIFFTDPLSPLPHDVDVKALTRLAVVYDLPMACSEATADMVIAHMVRSAAA
ncbi:methylglyoxal synthase [Roseospira visakhapatnamensis]|uniref:Methylglyoxal synthase n=1 Tax=Roseospira visakhapatnamensis TaxID=390880 RepID=A0A7W6RCA8_9PROT|nr:methylglyoxal synthase [Roseospira visakhapatnamensis]MBB4265792.1 methylglyoxal synthase [Roseospira visakhapatnamensis]